MKIIIELIVLFFLLRWISQAFRSNVTIININQKESKPQPKKEEVKISGEVKSKTTDNIGNYVDFEEL